MVWWRAPGVAWVLPELTGRLLAAIGAGIKVFGTIYPLCPANVSNRRDTTKYISPVPKRVLCGTPTVPLESLKMFPRPRNRSETNASPTPSKHRKLS